MHPGLLVPELALYIIRFLADDCPGWRDGHYLRNPKDVASLARTCKALKEPALDVLWATQHSLAPLVMCLPPDLWELAGTNREKTLFFKRVPTSQEWLSVQRYSHRIHAISQPVLRMVPKLNDAVVAALVVPSNFGVLFPSLQSLDYSVITVAAPLIHLFTNLLLTGRHLESMISLRIICPRASHRQDVHDLFQAIRTKATRIESLRIESFASSSSGPSLAIKLVEGEFKYLRKLDLSWTMHVSRECLACLARMERLQELNICMRRDITLDFLANGCSCADNPNSIRSKATFPALKFLKVTAHLLEQCTALIALVTSPLLDSINFTYDVQAPSTLIQAFFQQVQRTCRDTAAISTSTAPISPSRTISLILKHSRALHSSTASPLLIHSSQTLSPLLGIRNLRVLHLLQLGTIAIDDGFLREAANAWGNHLQEFEECGVPWFTVEELNDLPGFVSATLDGIGAFVRGCSRLKKLRMAFDGRDVPLPGVGTDSDEHTGHAGTQEEDEMGDADNGYDGDFVQEGEQSRCSAPCSSSSPLQVLNVRDSPIDNPEGVAHFLKRVAPALRVICVEGPLDRWKKWREVEERMKLSGSVSDSGQAEVV